MISNFNQFIKEGSDIHLSYLALDWDDNILHMSTLIYMDHLINDIWVKEPVSTSKFAEIRNDSSWRIREDSFVEFRDFGPRGKNAFLDDTIEAINRKEYGPSWDAFIEYLSKGTIFAIITARGHEPSSIRLAIEYIIDNVLTNDQKDSLYSHCLKFAYLFNVNYDSYDRVYKGRLSKTKLISDYLDNCDFFGVSSDYFINRFGLGNTKNPEKGKELAIREFTRKVNSYGQSIGAKSVSIGFSDDDVKNVNHIKNLFTNELSLTYALKYNIYDTSKRGLRGGVRTKINHNESQSSIGNGASTWGLDSSILPFTKWNNMTNHLYSNSNDDYNNLFNNQIGQIGDLSKEIKKKE